MIGQMVDHTIHTLYSKCIGPRPPDLKPLVDGPPRLVLEPIFDFDEFICIDDYKDSAEMSTPAVRKAGVGNGAGELLCLLAGGEVDDGRR